MTAESRNRKPGKLVLEDGSSFPGESFGKHGSVTGEVVFTTGMVGYPESLTDPSYKGQILVCTYPLIGNYGVPARYFSTPQRDREKANPSREHARVEKNHGRTPPTAVECDPLRSSSRPGLVSNYAAISGILPGMFESDRIQVSGLIVADYSEEYSHWAAASSLELDYVGVKASQFSFSRLKGADPVTGVEMSSTGEVGCLGSDLYDAFLKALLSTGFKLPRKSILLSVSGDEHRFQLLESVQLLKKLGFDLYATEHTRDFFGSRGIEMKLLHKLKDKKDPNVGTYLAEGWIDMVISMPGVYGSDFGDTYHIRRMAVDYAVPLLNNPHMVKLFVNALAHKGIDGLDVRAWQEY